MMSFKNNPGFTLIEAMLALTIIALIMPPLFITQGTILRGVGQCSFHLKRIFFAENFLLDARNESAEHQKFTLEKKIDDPMTLVKYMIDPVDKKSSLHEIDGLVSERLLIEWTELGTKHRDTVVSFLYKPKQKKKKESS